MHARATATTFLSRTDISKSLPKKEYVVVGRLAIFIKNLGILTGPN